MKEMLLLSGEVSYRFKDDPDHIHTKLVNGLIGRPANHNGLDEPEITYILAGLKSNFLRFLESEHINKDSISIIDIVILNFQTLGVHDEKEFMSGNFEEMTDDDEPKVEATSTIQ